MEKKKAQKFLKSQNYPLLIFEIAKQLLKIHQFGMQVPFWLQEQAILL